MSYVFLFYRFKVEGRENIPKGKSFIVCPTHSGYLDPELVSFATKRPISYMAKKELFKNPILRWILNALGAFPVDRGSADLGTIRNSIFNLFAITLINLS